MNKTSNLLFCAPVIALSLMGCGGQPGPVDNADPTQSPKTKIEASSFTRPNGDQAEIPAQNLSSVPPPKEAGVDSNYGTYIGSYHYTYASKYFYGYVFNDSDYGTYQCQQRIYPWSYGVDTCRFTYQELKTYYYNSWYVYHYDCNDYCYL